MTNLAGIQDLLLKYQGKPVFPSALIGMPVHKEINTLRKEPGVEKLTNSIGQVNVGNAEIKFHFREMKFLATSLSLINLCVAIIKHRRICTQKNISIAKRIILKPKDVIVLDEVPLVNHDVYPEQLALNVMSNNWWSFYCN